jgi:hypothetical protein
MKIDRERELFEPAKIVPPPSPRPCDPRQTDLVTWLAEHPKVETPSRT